MLEQTDPTPIPTPISVDALASHFQPSSLETSDLLTAGIAILAGFVLGALARAATRRGLGRARGVGIETATIVSRAVGYLIILLGLVVGLSAIGLEFGPVVTILLIITLVAILVGRPMLSDLGAGVVLQSRRPISIGEVAQSSGHEGVITDIDGRVVTIRTWDGWDVKVRNSDVLTDPIVTVGDPGQIRVEFEIGVDYRTDLDAAVGIVTDVMIATPGILTHPAPTTMVDEFGDSTIVLRCWFWADPARRWFVKDEAMRRVKRALDEHGITIAFPQRVLHTA